MKSRGKLRRAVVAMLIGVLVGGGLMAVTPAGAQVAEAAATNWKKIWKKKLQPLADKRYYKKSTSDAKYATKAETSAAFANYYTMGQVDTKLGNYYTKAQSDANYYTKAQSDARYAPMPTLIRGTYVVSTQAPGAGSPASHGIDFGVTFSAPPTPHFIATGALPPAGCSGTPAAPVADPGHLCVFESGQSNIGARSIINQAGFFNTTNVYGAGIWTTSAAAGYTVSVGSWAARPLAIVSPTSSLAPKAPSSLGGGGSILGAR